MLYSAVDSQERLEKALMAGAYDLVSQASLDEASTGIARTLTQFAVVERRLRQAMNAQNALAGEVDPLSHLLMKVRVGLLILGPHGKERPHPDNGQDRRVVKAPRIRRVVLLWTSLRQPLRRLYAV